MKKYILYALKSYSIVALIPTIGLAVSTDLPIKWYVPFYIAIFLALLFISIIIQFLFDLFKGTSSK
jgi:hypothetical protein